MDGVLRVIVGILSLAGLSGFNPCSNGWCTSSEKSRTHKNRVSFVSILVLMDGVLRVYRDL